ncbi:hypothetical protein AB0I68_26660 [Streptomyces sp. NPDC050448]|uniref:hypothetical protein n=1 Tax=Streptomyces sp. NPDC050448 TaxID=3155404 RepID=UPI0034188E6E
MSLKDWLIDIALVAVVLLQLRGRRLTVKALLLPSAACSTARSRPRTPDSRAMACRHCCSP